MFQSAKQYVYIRKKEKNDQPTGFILLVTKFFLTASLPFILSLDFQYLREKAGARPLREKVRIKWSKKR